MLPLVAALQVQSQPVRISYKTSQLYLSQTQTEQSQFFRQVVQMMFPTFHKTIFG
jgi:hypothetical protein